MDSVLNTVGNMKDMAITIGKELEDQNQWVL
jgi:hypothetical protein